MLKILIERGVRLTFGSDCHKPEEVAFGSARVEALLGELGVKPDVQLFTLRRCPLLSFFP
jgi:histidinol phosphatase-like PHP family hydrolase